MSEEQTQQQKYQEAQRKAFVEMIRKQQERQAAAQAAILQMQRNAREHQYLLDHAPRRNYAVIAALDLLGGLSKDGKIPWNYPADFKWFQQHTKGHICVMGRGTYEDICNRLGAKAAKEVLPGRNSFVLSKTLKQDDIKNATVIREIYDVEYQSPEEDIDKTIFILGGNRVFREGIAMANDAYITIINKEYDCDKFFPTDYIEKYFTLTQQFKVDEEPDIRFLVYKRALGKFI